MSSKTWLLPFVAGAVTLALIGGIWKLRSAPAPSPSRMNAVVEPDARVPLEAVPRMPTRALDPGVEMAAMQKANEAAIKADEIGERRLRMRYDGETVDGKWATSKRHALESLSLSPQIEQLNAQPLSIVANCRTTICLIEADFPTHTAAQDWFTLYTMNAVSEMSHSAARGAINPDGTVRLQIYALARQ